MLQKSDLINYFYSNFTDPEYKFEFSYPSEVNMRSYNPPKGADTSRVKEAADLIATAKKPVIYSGGGVNQNNASEELTALAKLLNFQWCHLLVLDHYHLQAK